MSEEMTFPQRVWYVLSRQDVEWRLKKKGRFDYLPWADAWEILMEHFPESSYEFDPPHFFEGGVGGEQWVTLTIKHGSDSFQRRWWLPYLDHSNKPLANPTSLQINNTRMRCLVKCIAMCGLGISVFSGEDVPDKEADAKPVGRNTPRGASLDGVVFNDEEEAAINDWVAEIRETMPSKDGIDHSAALKVYVDLHGQRLGPEMSTAIWNKLDSWQRSELKKLRADFVEKQRAEAVEKISEQGVEPKE